MRKGGLENLTLRENIENKRDRGKTLPKKLVHMDGRIGAGKDSKRTSIVWSCKGSKKL